MYTNTDISSAFYQYEEVSFLSEEEEEKEEIYVEMQRINYEKSRLEFYTDSHNRVSGLVRKGVLIREHEIEDKLEEEMRSKYQLHAEIFSNAEEEEEEINVEMQRINYEKSRLEFATDSRNRVSDLLRKGVLKRKREIEEKLEEEKRPKEEEKRPKHDLNVKILLNS